MKNSIQNTLQKSQEAFTIWKKVSFEERQKPLYRLSELLMERKEELKLIGF